MRIFLLAPLLCLPVILGVVLGVPAPALAAPGPGQGGGLMGVMGGEVVPHDCAIPSIRAGRVASLRSFHRATAECADRFWADRFAAAGLAYTPPAVQITTGDDSVCGAIGGSGAQYCPQQRTIVIRVTEEDVREPFRMNLAHSVAHEWGHHVQGLIGVLSAQSALYGPASGDARRLLNHRLEMQAECFAGVFYSAALDSIDPGIGWEAWMDAVRLADESDIHGKPRNLAFWQNRGYRGGATGFCNTWTAGRDKIS
ncbi:neutral zinc metallopeptidase [Nonomuraea terrae]|uniref:neutral zinc metallopeptidase n=1 Tax=Nonomuraea terrae TaxID=2530383 RepID=UPI00379B19D1